MERDISVIPYTENIVCIEWCASGLAAAHEPSPLGLWVGPISHFDPDVPLFSGPPLFPNLPPFNTFSALQFQTCAQCQWGLFSFTWVFGSVKDGSVVWLCMAVCGGERNGSSNNGLNRKRLSSPEEGGSHATDHIWTQMGTLPWLSILQPTL